MDQHSHPTTNENIFGIRTMNLFNAEECQKIISSAITSDWQSGSHASGSGVAQKNIDTDYRRVSMQSLPCLPENWPLNTVLQCLDEVNLASYKFDTTGLKSAIDYPTLLKYEECNQGHYGWHLDLCGGFSTRKLTFSIQLTDSVEYEGCDLEFAPPQTYGFGPEATFESIRQSLRQQGQIIIFPAYLLHRVTPISRGTRYAIVGWIHGPAFK